MLNRVHIVPEQDREISQTYTFSQAVWHGDTLYCSGQIGTRADGTLPASMDDQFVQAFENVSAVLKAAGTGWHDVVDITTYHVGLNETLGTFAEIKKGYVKEPFPAWTAIGVAELAYPDALVEIRVIARAAG